MTTTTAPPAAKRLLVVDNDAATRAALVAALGDAGAVGSAALDELPGEGALVVAEWRALSEPLRAALVRDDRHVVFLVDSRWQDQQRELLHLPTRNRVLIARNANGSAGDVAVSVAKLWSGELFGPAAYVAGDVSTLSLTSSREKERAVSEARAFGRQLGLTGWQGDRASIVVDELVTNAIYNAPIELTPAPAAAAGRRPYAGLPRTTAVELAPEAAVKVTFRCDGARFAVAVEDAYGSLEPGVVTAYLAKCLAKDARTQVDDKPGGAGLGLYTVFDASAHLVVNIDPGVRTEVIAILDVMARSPAKSLSIFTR